MRKSTIGALAVAVATGVAARRAWSVRQGGDPSGGQPGRQHEPRWHVVMVNRPPEEVAPEGGLPKPLAELGDRIEVRVGPGVGNRGTALAARLREGEPSGLRGTAARITGDDPRQELRSALRRSRQLVETGEILHADTPPTTKRTLTGLPLELASRRAGGEGRL